MKKRVKIDSSILSFVIILTGFLYLFPNLYVGNKLFDNVFDFLGFMLILKGNLLRMAARGHKKAHSKKGASLVMTGPYILTRNPMYLGSFLIGAGFVLLVWPWWALLFFAWLFYLRFNKQVVKEEEALLKAFGDVYRKYCKKTARIFPSFKKLHKIKTRDIIHPEELFSTKEKNGLWGWSLLAIVLESFQELLIFGVTNPGKTLIVYFITVFVLIAGFWISYKYS